MSRRAPHHEPHEDFGPSRKEVAEALAELQRSKRRYLGFIDFVSGSTLFVTSGEWKLLAFQPGGNPLQPGQWVSFVKSGLRAEDIRPEDLSTYG